MGNRESYRYLLDSPLWDDKRRDILYRDDNTCQLCGDYGVQLHVHHRYYKQGLKPWEYKDSALITLCENCHELIHSGKRYSDIMIGDIFEYEHSDFTNRCIVYFVNGRNNTVSLLEYDNGAGTDSIYDNVVGKDRFWLYDKVTCRYPDCLFDQWFTYVANHLYLTPKMFRLNFEQILYNNRYLRNIVLNNTDFELE